MNTLEERMRAAARAVADAVPENSAPPLRLPAPPHRVNGGPVRRQWRAWRTPLAAAAAVVAVIAASLALTARPGKAPGPGDPLRGLPAYYVSVTSARNPGHHAVAVIRSTATGQPIVRVAPPRPYTKFAAATAAADDRTFVIGAQHQVIRAARFVTLTRLYLLRFDPVTATAQLTPLPIPEESASVSGLALSPDGSRLAVALNPPGNLKITVISVTTGAGRTWAGRSSADPQPGPHYLSWTADGRTLAYDWTVLDEPGHPYASDITVSLLDTTAPGGSLSADSVAVPGTYSALDSQELISPDGKLIIFAKLWPNPTWGVHEESTRTHRPANMLGRIPKRIMGYPYPNVPVTVSDILWSNADGSTLIVYTGEGQLGVLGHGGFMKLPGTLPLSPLGIAW